MNQQLPRKHDLRQGERVGLWARPAESVLYLFGYGQYMGEEYFNGESHPVMRLDHQPTQDYVVHYQHVTYGREQSIARQCEHFKGEIHNVDLKAFLEPGFEPPKSALPPDASEPSKAQEALRPKTAFDKMHQLSQEVATYRKKLEMHQLIVTDTRELIQGKLEEMNEVKAKAFAEVTALEKGEELTPFVDNHATEPVKQNESSTEDGDVEEVIPPNCSPEDDYCDTCGADYDPRAGCAICN